MLLVLVIRGSAAFASGPFQSGALMDREVMDSLLATGWVQDESASKAENARLVSSGLAVLLGPFGAHRLYLGTTPKVAVIYGITFGGFGVLVLVDLDRYRNSDRVFMWNREGEELTPP